MANVKILTADQAAELVEDGMTCLLYTSDAADEL